MSQLARQVFGLPIPDAGALFDVALGFHIAAGLTCVITGVLARRRLLPVRSASPGRPDSGVPPGRPS